MKRFLAISIGLMLAVVVRAQGVEMFSLEREISVPGIQKKDLQERAYTWLRTLGSAPASEYDLFTHIGYRTDWIRRACNISFKGKDHQTEYTFTLSLISTEDGQLTVRLYRPTVSSFRGSITILSADDLPVFYGGYKNGMFGATQNKETRFFICDEVKRLLTEEFEVLIPSITQALEGRIDPLELVRD